jgi:glyoxylase-like metal-dependent hydrolase (beta-lactamase superfamily II)
MRRAGLDPDAVHHVVVSHGHGDHIGQIAAFPHARIIGGPGSARFARDDIERARWRELDFDSAGPFGPFDAAIDFPGDGSSVFIRGGGHAPEGVMLFLALDEGAVLLTGDAVVHSDWLRSNDVQRIATDADRAAVVRSQVRSFLAANPDATIAYGHDLRDLACERRDIICHD